MSFDGTLLDVMRSVFLLAILISLRSSAQDSKPLEAKKDPEQIGVRDVSKGVNFYSIEKEMALGRQMSQQIEQQAKLLGDKQITEYVDRVGQNLARHSDSKIPLTVKVIEGEEPNAVTLPGGYIYVNTGLIRIADTETELAAAMAHEIAHVAARHGTRQATQSQILQVGTIPLIFLGLPGLCMRGAGSLILPPGLLAVQRGYEAEADLLGLQYLYKSGYDPLGMVDIFEKILSVDVRKHGKILANLLASHPESGDRLSNVQKNIEALLKARPEYIVNTSDFDNVKARLAVLDWIPKPEPPPAPERPTLRRKGDQLVASKKLVPDSDARASQIKEAYTIR
jgi:beta-barrel assembly-enhancing protease